MSGRVLIGVAVLAAFAVCARPLQAQTAAPSAADIEQQLRPAPRLGPSQGLPHIGVSGPDTNPTFQPASTSPERGGTAPPAAKRLSSWASASHMQAPAEAHAP